MENDFTKNVELDYWSKAKHVTDTTDDKIKGRLCFGDPNNGIPYMAGYAFAYQMVKNYVEKHPLSNFEELYFIEALDFIDAYKDIAFQKPYIK